MEQQIDKGIGWLQKLLTLQRKYGFLSIIKGLIILFVGGYVIFFALNPRYLLERVTEIQTEQHDNLVQSRLTADSKIRLILSKGMNYIGADRAWLVEFHNGSKNLSTALPFLFGSMRIEETRDGIENVDEDYADFSLSKYPLIQEVLSEGFFYGNIEKIKEHDKRLYYKFKANDINQMALLTLYNGEKPVGIIGFSFCGKNEMDPRVVGGCIRRSGVQIATLLSKIK